MLVRMTMLVLALGAAAGCERRPDFDIDRAQMELAAAFEKQTRQIAVYSDGRGEDPLEWIVDFRIDGIEPSLQARFRGTKTWELTDVRETPSPGEDKPWESVGVLLGRIRGEARTRAEETMARMAQLSDLIGQYAVRNGNRFPEATMPGLRELLIADGSIQEKDWKHDTDAWGQSLLYHAAPDGNGYILLSMGADGALDQEESVYFRNADQGFEAYGGRSANPDADIIVASGGFVQSYEP
jgi:hypothetical protein